MQPHIARQNQKYLSSGVHLAQHGFYTSDLLPTPMLQLFVMYALASETRGQRGHGSLSYILILMYCWLNDHSLLGGFSSLEGLPQATLSPSIYNTPGGSTTGIKYKANN